MYLRLLDSAFPSTFLRTFLFNQNVVCGVISLTDAVDLLILIIMENTQIYWMEVFLSFGAV